jgi:hypothetical protein
MSRMDTDENDVTEEEEPLPVYDIALVLGAIDDERRAQLQAQLDDAGRRLEELTATLAERSGRDSWKTNGARVELFDSGQSMIKGSVVDPEEELEFNVELRPDNFFDEARPWRPGEPPRPMSSSAWDVEGEALVMRVARVSGRKYSIQESVGELEETRHGSPEEAVAAFSKYVDDLAELALSRDPVAAAWQSDVDEYGTPADGGDDDAMGFPASDDSDDD